MISYRAREHRASRRNWLRGSSALTWAPIVALAAAAAVPEPASAQTPNISGATANVLNLISPFLSLNSTAIGQQTLQVDLSQAVAINQNAPSVALLNGFPASTTALAALAISDENALSSASNTVYGISTGTKFGVAANMAGGLPTQNTTSYNTFTNGAQPVGGLGAVLGPAYVTGVNPSSTLLPNTVNLLTTAFNFTGNLTNAPGSQSTGDAQVAKFYFANGTWNGTTAAVAPAGFTLPTFTLSSPSTTLPNTTNSVYDIAFGVTNKQAGQNQYGDSHPYQTYSAIPGATYTLYDPTVQTATTAGGAVNPDKPSTNPAFPSSHMAYAFTDSVLIGMLVPQFYQSMLMRASAMGESRIVIGVHYPTDIIASRAYISYDLAQYLSNPAYINNAAMTGTAASGNLSVNLPSLFNAAAPELQTYLTANATGCGGSIAACASTAAQNPTQNPYAPSSTNAQIYEARLTYGLPILTFAQAPREQAPAGGPDASILLATLYGGSTSAAQTIAPNGGIYGNLSTNTINQIIVNTETNALAAFYGTSLSYWSRINLYAAAGYFGAVTGTINLASTDQVNTNVVVAGATTNVNGDVVPAGVLAGAGTINGNVTVNSGGALAPGVPNTSPGTTTIQGNLLMNGGSAYDAVLNPTATSLTKVAGSATIGSGVPEAAYFASGVYTVGAKVPILTATGGLSGTFSSLAVSSSGGINVVPTLSYDAQNAYLTLAQAPLPTLPAGSPTNTASVANSLNTYIADGALPAALQNLYLLTPGAYANALNQLGSQLGSASTQASTMAMNNFMGLLFDFVGGPERPSAGAMGFAPEAQLSPEAALAYAAVTPKDALPLKAPAIEPRWSFWGSAFGGSSHLDGDPTVGSQTLTARNFGSAAGGNTWILPNTKVGFALGGGETSFSLDNGFGSGRTDYFLASGNARAFWGEAYVASALAGGAHWVTSNRTIAIGPAFDNLSASYTMPVVAGRLESGYRFGNTVAGVTPYGALQVQTAFMPSYTESSTLGTGLANIVAANNATSTRSELGAWVDAQWWNNLFGVSLRGRAAWVHEYSRDATVNSAFVAIPGATFSIVGAQRPADAALVSAVAELPITRTISLSGKFDGEFGNGATSWAGTGRVRWVW